MLIEVSVFKDSNSSTDRGNLLEGLISELLKIQDYNVINNLGMTGVEVDVHAVKKNNSSRNIFAECKAYSEKSKIQADVITRLIGNVNIHKYQEGWLFPTSEYGKEAKGLIEKIKNSEESNKYTFYTPSEIIDSLVRSNNIVDISIINEALKRKRIPEGSFRNNATLLISPIGNFWVKKYLSGGIEYGLLYFYASSGNFVVDKRILENLAKLDTSFSSLEHETIFCLNELEDEYTDEGIKFSLSREYVEKMNDVGHKIKHPNNENLKLKDIYIYPDLEILDSENGAVVNSERILDDGSENFYKLIIGSDVSGKTSLSYCLQDKLVNDKLSVSIQLSAESLSKNYDLDKIIINSYKEQYGSNTIRLKHFEKLLSENNNKISLIIDNFDNIDNKKTSRGQILLDITNRFNNVIIFASDNFQFESIIGQEFPNVISKFNSYKLKEFGYYLRGCLVDKWIRVGIDEGYDENILLEKKDRILSMMSITIGVNFVPTFPVYLLTMLQFFDDSGEQQFEVSSYAELYNFLITKSLISTGISAGDLEYTNSFMASLSYYFYKNNMKEIERDVLASKYNDFAKEMDISKKFESVLTILVKSKLLNTSRINYKFNHRFTYYYYLAKYISENISEKEVCDDVKKITSTLYVNDNSHIILFLIHRLRDRIIIDQILDESSKLFKGSQPFLFSKTEADKINSLIESELELLLKNISPQDYRNRRLIAQDEKVNERDKNLESNESDNSDELIRELNLSLRIIKLQGQVLKNHFGILKSNTKAEIIDSAKTLSMRSLNAFLVNIADIQEIILSKINQINADKKEKNLEHEVCQFMFRLQVSAALAFIKTFRVGFASKDIMDSIKKMNERDSSIATRLMYYSIKLNFNDGCDVKEIIDFMSSIKDNYYASAVLRLLVAEHLYKFELPISDKQKLCSALNISITSNMIMAPRDI